MPHADLKSPMSVRLSFGSRVAVTQTEGRLRKTALRLYTTHILRPLPHHFSDPAAVPRCFFGAALSVGGETAQGESIARAPRAGRIPLPAAFLPRPNSDQQQASFCRTPCPIQAISPAIFRRNDLLFWEVHVALVLDPTTMIQPQTRINMARHTRKPVQERLHVSPKIEAAR